MREIKFRGKCTQSGDWVFGDLIHGVGHKDGKTFILPKKVKLAYVKHCDPLDGVMVNPETVGQFTGLHDKNGKEIYEGDILKWLCSKSGSKKEKKYTVVIGWRNGDKGYSLTIYDNGEKWATQKSYWNECEREVIGNIHQNPDLINQK